MEKGPSGEANS